MTARQTVLSGKKRKVVNVHLLSEDQLTVHVDTKSKFQEVFNQVVGHLSLRETEYFGLAFKKDNEYHFVVLDDKIHKSAPKQWKSSSGEGLDNDGKALINIWFRVQFYVDQVILLREKVTRHQYYLQLKDNVLQYNHLYSQEKCFQLAAYALQADHGNFVSEKFKEGYFDPCLYFPAWIVERLGTEYLAKNIPIMHQDLYNMTRNDAELRYIKNSSSPPGAHNLHFYTARKRKTDLTCNTWLAVCAKGVEVYEDDAGYKNHISTFLWRDIGKLYFDKKRFEIRSVQTAGGRRYMYYTDCDVKSKYLLNICRSTHMFQMAIQPKLLEIQHLDNEDQKRYRESYTNNDMCEKNLCHLHHHHLHHSPNKSMSATSSTTNQRMSVISDASSNTTSGIVSDRMAVSFDDGDDHKEIMIDCPPRINVQGHPSHPRSKFLSNNFKQSPQISKTNQSLFPHYLDQLKSDYPCNPSPQELSPTSSNGSWRAHHHQFTLGLGSSNLPESSPTTPTYDGKTFPSLRHSLGRKESFSKHLLLTGDRNTSGDSAVSVSGIFSSPDKLAPLSLPQSEIGSFHGSPNQGSASSSLMRTARLGSSSSANFPHSSPLPYSYITNTPVPSPPTSLNFMHPSATVDTSPSLHGYQGLSPRLDSGNNYFKHSCSPRENKTFKPLASTQDASALNSPLANIPDNYCKPQPSPSESSEHSKPLSSPQLMTPMYKLLGTSSDIMKEQLSSLQASPRGLHELKQAPGQVYEHQLDPTAILSLRVSEDVHTDHLYQQSVGRMKIEQPPHSHPQLQPPQLQPPPPPPPPQAPPSQLPIQPLPQQPLPLQPPPLQPPPQLQLQPLSQPLLQPPQHSAQLPIQPQSLQPPPQPLLQSQHHKYSPKTEHYLLALQQSSGMESSSSLPHSMSSHGYKPRKEPYISEHYLPYSQHHQQELGQRQVEEPKQHQPLPLHQMHGKASFEAKEPEQNTIQVESNLEDGKKVEAVKENLHQQWDAGASESTKGEDEIDLTLKQTHTPKGVLHPELKHILGQSNAISLPLITALCNDTSLMQSSRSQSGSRSSYDTSTVRSTDSRLTRVSLDTDSRRWSSCCQAAGGPELMMSVQPSRPYSWHSEHFDLNSHFTLPPVDHVSSATSPANPRAIKKHLSIEQNANDVPQKMIESDPGPSSPRMLIPNINQVSWWDCPHTMVGSDPGSSKSWADVIPYSLPQQLKKHGGSCSIGSNLTTAQQGQVLHQHMNVPHKLSSGGHRDSDSSMSHQQVLKENIGIA